MRQSLRRAPFAGTPSRKAKPPSSFPGAHWLAQAQDLTNSVPGFYISGLCRGIRVNVVSLLQ